MGRKRKPKVKGKHQGKSLSPVKKEQIRQTYMITGNKQETARMCGVSGASVYNVLREAEEPEAATNRAQLGSQLAGHLHVKAKNILDSITEKDLESGYLTDDDGNLLFDKQGRPIWTGPNLNQKAVSAAIMVDKLQVLEDYRQRVAGETGSGELPTPENIQQLVSGIANKVKKLRVLDVEFEDSGTKKRADDLLDKAQEELERAEEIEAIELDFDNPGGDT